MSDLKPNSTTKEVLTAWGIVNKKTKDKELILDVLLEEGYETYEEILEIQREDLEDFRIPRMPMNRILSKIKEQKEVICENDEEFFDNIAKDINKSESYVNCDINIQDKNTIDKTLNIVAKRAFNNKEIEVTNTVRGRLSGDVDILFPNGDIKSKTLNNEVSIKSLLQLEKNLAKNVYFEKKSMAPMKPKGKNVIKFNKLQGFNDKEINITENKESDEKYNKLFDISAKNLTARYMNSIKNNESILEKALYNRNCLKNIPKNITIKTKKPTKSKCGAFFTGLVLSGTFKENHWSVPYKIDGFSEYVGQGEYAKNSTTFPTAVATTFDGIAIDNNTRVIIYAKENFEGEILLDEKGPKIINNVNWKNDIRYSVVMNSTWPGDLQKIYPPHVRIWSKSNMHNWSYGSVKVLCKVN